MVVAKAGLADTAASSEYAMKFAKQRFKTAASLRPVPATDRARPFGEA